MAGWRHREGMRHHTLDAHFQPTWGVQMHNGRECSRQHYYTAPGVKLCRFRIMGLPHYFSPRVQPYAGDACYYCLTILRHRAQEKEQQAARTKGQYSLFPEYEQKVSARY